MLAGKGYRHLGFTLVELLVTLAVIIILATIAVPGFQKLIHDNRLIADHNSILAGLRNARSEAVAQRKNISFTLSPEEAGGWRYQVALDETVLMVREEIDSPVAPSGDDTVVFNSLGQLAGGATCKTLTLTLDDSSESLYVWGAGNISGEDCSGA